VGGGDGEPSKKEKKTGALWNEEKAQNLFWERARKGIQVKKWVVKNNAIQK